MARHRTTPSRYGWSRLWRAPRRKLNEVLWFRGWIVVVGLPVALIGVGVTELMAGHAFGLVWLFAAVLPMLIFALYARRPVVGNTASPSPADAERTAPRR